MPGRVVRHPATDDVLENRWLHRAMMLLNGPANWPVAKVAVAQCAAAFGVAAVWFLAGAAPWQSALAGALSLAFLGSDLLVLWLLPRLGLSYGTVGAQAFVLGICRVGLMLVLGVMHRWLPFAWLLGAGGVLNLVASAA